MTIVLFCLLGERVGNRAHGRVIGTTCQVQWIQMTLLTWQRPTRCLTFRSSWTSLCWISFIQDNRNNRDRITSITSITQHPTTMTVAISSWVIFKNGSKTPTQNFKWLKVTFYIKILKFCEPKFLPFEMAKHMEVPTNDAPTPVPFSPLVGPFAEPPIENALFDHHEIQSKTVQKHRHTQERNWCPRTRISNYYPGNQLK